MQENWNWSVTKEASCSRRESQAEQEWWRSVTVSCKDSRRIDSSGEKS